MYILYKLYDLYNLDEHLIPRGDALSELKRNVDGYLAQVRARTPQGAAS